MRLWPFPLSGDVDMAVADELRDKLLALANATTGELVLDCTDLAFIDSMGISAVMYVQRVLEIDRRRLHLENLNGMARRAFDVLGLLEVIDGERAPA